MRIAAVAGSPDVEATIGGIRVRLKKVWHSADYRVYELEYPAVPLGALL